MSEENKEDKNKAPVAEAPVAEAPVAEAPEEQQGIDLGDRILIVGGVLDGLRGKLYYLDETLLGILPDGVLHRIERIPIVDGDFDEKLGITNVYVLKKRVSPAFVVQSDFQEGYLAETVKPSGEMGITYKITSINEAEDSAVFVDNTGAEKKIAFNFTGIPQDEEFVVIRVREPVEEVPEQAPDAPKTVEEEEGLEILDSLVVPEFTEIREIYATQRFYPDVVQRNDMIQDLLSGLTVKQQKNPQRQSEIRKLVELMIHLRNQVTKYNKSGEPSGLVATYYSTLAQLLEKGVVPLSRRVAPVKRVLYLDHSTEGIRKMRRKEQSGDPVTTGYDTLDVQYLQDIIKESNEYYEGQIGGIQSQQLNPDILPNWYLSWEGYFSRYMKSWTAGANELSKSFGVDSEFFRGTVPDAEVKLSDGLWTTENEKVPVGIESIKDIHYSLLRGLGPRMGRLREKDAPRVVESSESTPIENYILFPLRYDRDLGAIRSGKLAVDMDKGMGKPRSMLQILKEQPVTEVPAAGAIISLNSGSLGNITIEDWLRGQPLQTRGFADVMNLLSSCGLNTKELSLDQMEVVIEKLDAYRALVRASIQKNNEDAKTALEAISLENNPLLNPDTVTERIAQLMTEPWFQKAVSTFQARFPTYRENDIALFAYLFTQQYDFTLAVLSGAPMTLQREIRRKSRGDFLERLHQATKLLEKKQDVGEVPQPNPCPHVPSLTAIRKIKDADLRMRALVQFLTKFRGEMKDNWLHCIVCSQHALCNHELLLIQEYLRPKEKDVLHKELLLAFSGGQFQGRYICKNCGQSISDIDYDSSLEFDDEGRPMMGRAQLVDKDAILQDEIEQFLGPAIVREELVFSTELQTMIYGATKQLSARVGIQLTEAGFRKIAARVEADLLKQPNREEYAKYQKASKAKGVATLDYDVLRNRVLVLSLGAYLLIEVQTAIPNYTIRYKLPGCRATFSGFPMTTKEQTGGVEYVACGIASINDSVAPWNLTGFQKERVEEKRRVAIAKFLMPSLESAIKGSEVQHDISLKKEAMEKVQEIQTEEEGLVEKVPAGFAPPQKVEGGPPVIAEAAGDREKARAWILLANQVAKENASIQPSNPYSEVTCCYHSISSPSEFWDKATLPALVHHRHRLGPKGSHLAVPFKERKQDPLRVVASDSILYRVFLQVCFEGPRKGLPHEPGYDNLCLHCGFQFPSAAPTPEEGKVALDSQNIDTSRDRFQELLDESHNRYSVEKKLPAAPLSGIALLEKVMAIKPTPFDGLRPTLAAAIEALKKMPADRVADEIDIATAYGPLSNLTEEFKQVLAVRLGQENARTIEALVNQNPTALVQSLQTYFLIPFQRLNSGFHIESLRVQKSYDLGKGTVDDLHELLSTHFGSLGEMKMKYKGVSRAKIQMLRKRLAAAIPVLQTELRTPLVPGGKIGLPYLIQAMVLGMFAECADPNNAALREVEEEEETLDIQTQGAMQILAICLGRFKVEGLNFTEEEIKSKIARRDEVEKMRIISRFDKMSPEQKAVELTNKRLGLGVWAVGGTSMITAYNPEQYERERVERAEMRAVVPADEVGREEGYGNEQTAADDY